MINGNVLVILFSPSGAEGARQTLRHAMLNAARPQSLRFLLPSYAFQDLQELQEKGEPISFFPYQEGLPGACEQIGEESCFLLLMGDAHFEKNWDQVLIRKLPGEDCLLTATPWSNPATGKKESCLPALKLPFDAYGIPIGQGLPLVCAKKQQEGLLIDPALLFGPVGFLQLMKPDITTLSYSAFLSGHRVLWLEEAPLISASPLPPRRLCRPVAQVLPGSALHRFEQMCGIRFDARQVTVKAQAGLAETARDYTQVLPLREKAAGLLRLDFPYLVTGFVDFPSPHREPQDYLLHFEWLRRMECFSLLTFTGGEMEESLRGMHPNTASFPARDLPKPEGMSISRHFKRSKPFLLLRAQRRHPGVRHFAWVDLDILPHPVPKNLRPDFRQMLDDQIHLATVEGVPDCSCLIVPAGETERLCREVAAVTEMDVALHASLGEEELWRKLISRHPERYCLHPMEKRQMLFLSAFPRGTLSRQISHFPKEKQEENQ